MYINIGIINQLWQIIAVRYCISIFKVTAFIINVPCARAPFRRIKCPIQIEIGVVHFHDMPMMIDLTQFIFDLYLVSVDDAQNNQPIENMCSKQCRTRNQTCLEFFRFFFFFRYRFSLNESQFADAQHNKKMMKKREKIYYVSSCKMKNTTVR